MGSCGTAKYDKNNSIEFNEEPNGGIESKKTGIMEYLNCCCCSNNKNSLKPSIVIIPNNDNKSQNNDTSNEGPYQIPTQSAMEDIKENNEAEKKDSIKEKNSNSKSIFIIDDSEGILNSCIRFPGNYN